MSVDLIIFDLDGTLVDSCEDITRALNYCLSGAGSDHLSCAEVREMVGEGVKRLIEKVIEKKKISMDKFSQLLDCFIRYYSDHIADFSRLYPDVAETLRDLESINKAVVSNKLTELTRKTLQSLGIIHHFQFIAGSDYFEEQKPSALPILKTMERFNATREKTIMVGDSEIDIKAGKSARIWTVAVTYGYGKRSNLNDADFIIDRLSELKSIVKNFSTHPPILSFQERKRQD